MPVATKRPPGWNTFTVLGKVCLFCLIEPVSNAGLDGICADTATATQPTTAMIPTAERKRDLTVTHRP